MEQFNGFSGDKYIADEFLKLKNEFNITVAIETGTLLGGTTEWLSDNFETVYSVDNNFNTYNICLEKFENKTNINLHLKDSVVFVEEMVELNKDNNCIFFLDSHGALPTPTPYELRNLVNLNIKPCIVIHDFYVPGKNLNYDSYQDFDYKFESIKDILDEIYDYKYEYYYNSVADGPYNVGCIFIKPKK